MAPRRTNKRNVNTNNKDENSSLEVKTCELCGKTFQNSHALTMHLKEHKSNSVNAYVCKLCKKILSSKSSLERHALVHSGQKPNKCDIFWGELFTTKSNKKRNMRLHDNGRKRKSDAHVCTDDCEYEFSELYTIPFSMNKYPLIAKIPCEMKRRCPAPSVKKAKLDKKMQNQKIEQNSGAYQCDRCDHCFPCQRTLTEHTTDCSRCKTCEVQFLKIGQFENHMQNHEVEREEENAENERVMKKGITDEEGKKENEDERRKYLFLAALGLTKSKEHVKKEPEELHAEAVSEESSYLGELIIDESVNVNDCQSNDHDCAHLEPICNMPNDKEKSRQAMDLVKNETFMCNTKSDNQLENSGNEYKMEPDIEENQEDKKGNSSMHSDIGENQNVHKNSAATNLKYDSEEDSGDLNMSGRPVSTKYSGLYHELINSDDKVAIAVDALLNLHKVVEFQTEPVHFSVRPIDLSSRDLNTPNPSIAETACRSPSYYSESSPKKINGPENGTVESITNLTTWKKQNRFKCESCGRTFRYSSGLQRHSIYLCMKSDARYYTKSKRERPQKRKKLL